MGIVQRQSLWNSIWSYLGVGIGYLNKVYLYREFLTRDEYGLIELLLFWMVLGAELSQLGIGRIVIRFFPYFADNPRRQGEFTFFVFGYTIIGFAFFSLCFFIGQPFLKDVYAAEAQLFIQYLPFIIPLGLAYSLNKLVTALSQSLLKSVVPNFTEKFVMRMGQSVAILAYLYWELSLEQLLMAYTVAYSTPFFLNSIYLIWLGKLKFAWKWGVWRSRWVRILVRFGLFSLLADASIILVNRLDGIMLGEELGEASVGAYALAYYLAAIIYIPARALNAITMPIVARHMKRKDYPSVQSLYQKTALNNLILGGIFWIGISINIDSFFAIKDTFIEGRTAAILLGLSILVSVATGVNRGIIINSRYFRFDLYNNLAMLVLIGIGNYMLIPVFKETGAAMTTLAGLGLYNAINTFFVWRRFGIQPFVKETLGVVAVIGSVFALGWYLPTLENPYWDILYRSAVVSIAYVALIWGFGIAKDLVAMIGGMIAKRLKK
ncbi:MAG: lipopolysaccharide biosynthesis protein [Bacteroidia bacterium]